MLVLLDSLQRGKVLLRLLPPAHRHSGLTQLCFYGPCLWFNWPL